MLSMTTDKMIMLICESVPLACVVVEVGTLKVHCGNEAAARLTERPLDDLTGSSLRELMVDPAEWSEQSVDEIETEEETEREFQIALPGGEEIWITACSCRVDMEDEVFLVVVLNDVEERRQLEDSLADTAVELAMTSGFPEMNPGPVFRLSNKGAVILANAPARQVFGEVRVEGKSWLELCPGGDGGILEPGAGVQRCGGAGGAGGQGGVRVHPHARSGSRLRFRARHGPDATEGGGAGVAGQRADGGGGYAGGGNRA